MTKVILCFINFIFLVLLHVVFILISEVLFENHICEKVSSIKIITTYYLNQLLINW